MAILITGGTGYIGRFVTNELAATGHEVVALDVKEPQSGVVPALPSSATFIKCDVTEKTRLFDVVRAKPFSAIIHLAGIVTMACERDPEAAIRINVLGSANLLEAGRLAAVPVFVFASTISIYGPNVDQPMVEDKTPTDPVTWYGETKLMVEQLRQYYHRRWGMDFRAARLAAIVGPERVAPGSATLYTSRILENAALGEPYEIEVDPEGGTPVLYAPDAARGLSMLATAPPVARRAYHLSTGLVSASDLVRYAKQRHPNASLKFRTDPQLGPVSKISSRWQLSTSAAREDFGWSPSFTVESMAEDLMARAELRRRDR